MVEKEYFGEGRNIEYKREIPQNHEKFLKDIIAFSNTSGGKVIVGIEDETHIVYGIGDQNPFRLSDRISNMISDACTPQIDPNIAMRTLEGKTVLEIEVPSGKFRPYYIAKKGKETTAYIRINGTSRPADARKLKELELEGQNLSYDKMLCIGKEYDEKKALHLCEEMKRIALEVCKNEDEKSEVKDMTVEKLEDFGLLSKKGKSFGVTHAFDLMTDNKNRNAKVQCALFKGITRDIFIDQKEFGGPIYEQVDAAYHFVLRHINLGAEINGVYRNEEYELPIKAVREMIANAVVHRSYLDEACIQVCIFDDRMEVLSPGTLYGGLDIETAKMGKSRCRNEAIAEAFHYMRIIEAWGTGIPRMYHRSVEYGLPEPLFEEFGDGIKVTMFRKVVNAQEKVSSSAQNGVNTQEKVSSSAQNEVNTQEKVSSSAQNIGDAFNKYLPLFKEAEITDKYIKNIKQVYLMCGTEFPFGQGNVQEWLGCSKSKATNVMNAMKAAKIINKKSGYGLGKYEFIDL